MVDTVTFDNTSQRCWQFTRQRVLNNNNGVVITVTDMISEGSIRGLAEWEATRLGNACTTEITQPLVFRQDCLFRPDSGKEWDTTTIP